MDLEISDPLTSYDCFLSNNFSLCTERSICHLDLGGGNIISDRGEYFLKKFVLSDFQGETEQV